MYLWCFSFFLYWQKSALASVPDSPRNSLALVRSWFKTQAQSINRLIKFDTAGKSTKGCWHADLVLSNGAGAQLESLRWVGVPSVPCSAFVSVSSPGKWGPAGASSTPTLFTSLCPRHIPVEKKHSLQSRSGSSVLAQMPSESFPPCWKTKWDLLPHWRGGTPTLLSLPVPVH